MKIKIKNKLIIPLMALLSLPALAQQDFSLNDVVGTFAGTSHIGPYANTKTVTEAHFTCMSEMPDAVLGSSNYTSSGYDDYRGCMADYVPFKEPGAGEEGACTAQSVTWGQCSADVPALPDGTLFSARNSLNTEQYEGFASFQCSEGQLVYQSGGCSRAVTECEAGEVVSWPVTSPAWAQESPETQFTDKFGVVRHTPKDICYGRMPEALSGFLMQAKATTPEMAEPQRYVMGSAEAPKRCFDGEWLDQPGSGALRCDYVPKSCQAMTYTTPKGCEFELPDGEHDEVFLDSNPEPALSIGAVQAHCWDGEWEIKASSCTLSCAQTASSRTWSGDDSRACRHNNHSSSSRIPPGGQFIVSNITAGMDGQTNYLCVDGEVNVHSDQCLPQECGAISAAQWSGHDGASCDHDAKVPSPDSKRHDGRVTLSYRGNLPNGDEVTGRRSYVCKYGEWGVSQEECTSGTRKVCNYDPTDPTTEQDCLSKGGTYDNVTDTCCISSGSEKNCTPGTPSPPGGLCGVTPMPFECTTMGMNCDCDCGYWRAWTDPRQKQECV